MTTELAETTGRDVPSPARPAPAGERSRAPVVTLLVIVVLSALGVASCGGGGGAPSASVTDTGAEVLETTTGETVLTPGTQLELEEGEMLASGSEGESVRQLQEALRALGHDPGEADGVFGPATRRAVIDFQRSQDLDADGIVGQATIAAINRELARSTEDADR